MYAQVSQMHLCLRAIFPKACGGACKYISHLKEESLVRVVPPNWPV